MYAPGIGSISGAIHLFAQRPFISSMVILLAVTAAVVRVPAVAPPPPPPTPSVPTLVYNGGYTHNGGSLKVESTSTSRIRHGVKHSQAVGE
jgi:hypothetical protein